MMPSRIVLVLLFVALLILAWTNRFIQDDAFISFRHAEGELPLEQLREDNVSDF
jgi:hypothetical protein